MQDTPTAPCLHPSGATLLLELHPGAQTHRLTFASRVPEVPPQQSGLVGVASSEYT